VLLHEIGQFVDEGRAESCHAVVVGLRHAHPERVRHEHAVARDDRRLRVDLALERCGDLDGLQSRTEGLRECAVDGALETLLEVVQ
jgi:hypothetical protein